MKSFISRALRVAVITPEVGLRRRVSQAIQAPGRVCNQFSCSEDLRPSLERGVTFDLLIIAVSGEGETGRKRLADAVALLGCPPTLLLVDARQLDWVSEFMVKRRGNDFSLLSSSPEDLECRLRAFLSREGAVAGGRQLAFGRYRFVVGTQQVFVDEVPVRLTRLEFEVALFLFRNMGSNVSRERLYQSVWNAELGSNTRTIDAHVGKVRKALDLVNSTEFVLRSIYRDGYRLDTIEAPEPPVPATGRRRASSVRTHAFHIARGIA